MCGADGERESFGKIGIVGMLFRVVEDASTEELRRTGQGNDPGILGDAGLCLLRGEEGWRLRGRFVFLK